MSGYLDVERLLGSFSCGKNSMGKYICLLTLKTDKRPSGSINPPIEAFFTQLPRFSFQDTI